MNEIIKVFPSIILIGSANVLLKWRITYLNQKGFTIFSSKFFNFLQDPYIICGMLATILSITWWLSIISSVRISIVYPVLQAGSIIVTLILSIFLLNESLDLNQFLAIFFIILGILILAAAN